MQEVLKIRRKGVRNNIATGFNTYATEKENEIGDHYASEARKKSAELKDLLTRYAQALEKRASIEKSIEDIVSSTREDLNELNVILTAAYSGRQQQSHTAAGSVRSIVPMPAKNTTSTSPTNIRNNAHANGGEKEGYPCNRDHSYAGKENVFDPISW
ncbi:hypothetical protein F4803DRAFT_499163 [Xylaria telfairii]|nr:hypothetical protein F4803DRAFT_499163 [Xylaria telfairii]